MKKAGCLFALVLLASPSVSAQFSLKVAGGWTFLSPADYNDAVQGRNDYLAAISSSSPQGSFGKISGGWTIAAEVMRPIGKTLSAGISIGYLRTATDGQVAYQYPTTSPSLLFGGTAKVSTSISAAPVLAQVQYTLPVSKALTVQARGGAGVYFCSVHFGYDFVGGYMGATDWNESQTFAGRKLAFGCEGEVGLEVRVAKKIFVQANVGGRWAKISNLQGDYSDVGKSDRGPYSYQSDKGYFTVFDYSYGGKAYHQYAFDDNLRPSSPNYRRGDLSLAGLSLSGGIRIAL
jgi:hypothetical protein